MEMNNPAGRLLNILTIGKEHTKNEAARTAWATILDVPSDKQYLLIGRIGKVFALADDINEELQRIDNIDVTRFMSWTTYLEKSFSNCHLDNPWHSFINQISESALDYLHMSSSMLSTNRPQPVLDEGKLKEIYDEATNLASKILSSDLPAELKKYFIEQLRKICTAIEEYKITGSAEVVEIIEATFGKAVLNSELVSAREHNGAAKSFWGFMAKTALVISSIAGTVQIGDSAIKMFPELASPITQTIEVETDSKFQENTIILEQQT